MTTVKTQRDKTAMKAAIAPARQRIDPLVVDKVVLPGYFVTVIGLYLDTWAHKHLAISGVEDFFTPYHLALYAGLLLNIVTMAGLVWVGRRNGASWRGAIPAGYQLSVLGMGLFALGGVGDMLWHTLFGIEEGFDAGYSPTHLLVAIAIALIVTGPLRAAGARRQVGNLLPAVLAATFFWSLISVLTLFIHPFVTPVASQLLDPAGNPARMDQLQGSGLAAIIVQTVAFCAILFTLMRQWRLPAGSLTLFFGFNGLLLSVVEDHFFLIPGALVAGILLDLICHTLPVDVTSRRHLHLFTFLLPFLVFIVYFGNLMLQTGIWWTIHLWLGASVMAGFIGLGLGYLAFPAVAARPFD